MDGMKRCGGKCRQYSPIWGSTRAWCQRVEGGHEVSVPVMWGELCRDDLALQLTIFDLLGPGAELLPDSALEGVHCGAGTADV